MADTSADADYEKSKKRRGYHELDARDPHDLKIWTVLLSGKKAEHTARKGLGAVNELAETVRWTLLHPRHIFRGVRHEQPEIDETEWLCYVAVPTELWDHKLVKKRPAYPNEVFLVFVTDERVVYHWCWTAADVRDSTKPENFDQRFTEKV